MGAAASARDMLVAEEEVAALAAHVVGAAALARDAAVGTVDGDAMRKQDDVQHSCPPLCSQKTGERGSFRRKDRLFRTVCF